MSHFATRRGARTDEAWMDVPQPAEWTWTTCPVVPQRLRNDVHTFRAWDPVLHKVFDVRDYAPIGPKIYYVDYATGNDANTGLSWAQALKAIKTAVAKGDQDIIYIKAGTYPRGYGWEGTTVNRSYSVIAVDGQVLISNHYAGLVWAADPVNVGAWQTTVPAAVWGVWDAADLDGNGNYTALTLAADAAGVAATAGSWYLSGTDLWVQTSDSRAPDSDVLCYADADGKVFFSGIGYTSYIEGLTVEGSNDDAIYVSHGTHYGKNCKAGYTKPGTVTSKAFSIYDADAGVIWQNCEAYATSADGFCYHANGGHTTRGIEISCYAHEIGDSFGDQCSTTHDGNKQLCIMSSYAHAYGSTVVDISASTEAWYLGCIANDPRGDSNYSISGVGAYMWLDGCTSSEENTYDITAGADATLYYRNLVWASKTGGLGTITTY